METKENEAKCKLVLYAQNGGSQWYFYSGCYKDVSGDKCKFLSLKPFNKGNVTVGNKAPGKIIGKGIVKLKSGRGKAKDVLFVDGMKHNLLSVSQICKNH